MIQARNKQSLLLTLKVETCIRLHGFTSQTVYETRANKTLVTCAGNHIGKLTVGLGGGTQWHRAHPHFVRNEGREGCLTPLRFERIAELSERTDRRLQCRRVRRTVGP
jgi:hypothetical protein